ncbi:L,D-transpeptidase [Maritimibacter dapengensis]|uniref:L,D-transpeptidase n=1 Tax=Maritimibacter dapengensis TaxID=2836868 RepID=UPI0021021755|nr:L,D-transpeptidase [Maritimibacter dapengensis]
MKLLRRAAPKLIAFAFAGLALAACETVPTDTGNAGRAYTADGEVLPTISSKTASMYREFDDGRFVVPAISRQYLSEDVKRQYVPYYAPYAEGTIVVDPYARKLYLISGPNEAMRYTIGVGKAGYGLRGEARVSRKEEWPYWTPTRNMLRREPEKYRPVAGGVEGGLENPLGARALYLYKGGRDTLFRIHGTPYPWTVGGTESGGCIRMFNQDAIHLYANTPKGTRVVVLSQSQMNQWTAPTTATAM